MADTCISGVKGTNSKGTSQLSAYDLTALTYSQRCWTLQTQMIWAVLILNTNGKPRLMKFFERLGESEEQKFLNETYSKLTKRSSDACNFLELATNEKRFRLVYRQYATIYVVFCVDAAESELGILDLIQVFVDLLDKTFENVCELDIIFNSEKVHYLLNELICGGIVLETKSEEILQHIHEQDVLSRLSSSQVNPSDHQLALQMTSVSSSTRLLSSVISSTTSRLRSHIRNTGQSVFSTMGPTTLASAAWRKTAQMVSASSFDRSGFREINKETSGFCVSEDAVGNPASSERFMSNSNVGESQKLCL